MNKTHLLKWGLWVMLTMIIVVYWCPAPSKAASDPVTPEAIKYSGPLDITASIMEIDLGKNMLIVAEKEIYVVDLIVGAEHFLTVLSDVEGGPVALEALDRGQTVQVRGLQLPDGRVLAEQIQISVDRSPRKQTSGSRPAIRQVRKFSKFKPKD